MSDFAPGPAMAEEAVLGELDAALADVASGRRSARSLLAEALERIERLNPGVGALSEVLADSAQGEAEQADQDSAERRGLPLAGLPMAVKDIVDTVPAACPAGLSILADYRPSRDATVVARLRRAGAAIVGVSVTDPGAFSTRCAAVTHPQAPALSVGGSSGGSAAALAAGFCLAAVGTDTGGSIRIPAACCAVAGLKPTYGRVSVRGVRPLVWSLDHVGPMARRVADLATVAGVLDPGFTATARRRRPRGAVGYDPHYYADAEPAVQAAMAAALEACRSLGLQVIEVSLPHPDSALALHGVIFAAESAAYYLQAFPDRWDELPALARQFMAPALEQRSYEYVQAMRARAELARQVDAAFDEVDAVIAPTMPLLPPQRDADELEVAGQPTEFTVAMIRYTCLFNHSGHPVVALPAAVLAPGVAPGVQLVGARNCDAALVALATRLEAALDLAIDFSPRLSSQERPS